MPSSSEQDTYKQILSDVDLAKKLMYPKAEEPRMGYPAAEATSMLKAKVYMTLATADPSVQPDSNANYWQKAYTEAKNVYEKYSLVGDYTSLWDENVENTSESIFEIQFNEIQPSNFPKLFTAGHAIIAKTWGHLRINPELYDLQASIYPNDPRINATYVSEYVKTNNGKTAKTYPTTARKNFTAGFPYLYKYFEKNVKNANDVNNQNYIVYFENDLLFDRAPSCGIDDLKPFSDDEPSIAVGFALQYFV